MMVLRGMQGQWVRVESGIGSTWKPGVIEGVTSWKEIDEETVVRMATNTRNTARTL